MAYKVTGTAETASLTYSNRNGDTVQVSSVRVPWTSKAFQAEAGAFLYISAQNNGESGNITCSIYLNGEKVRSNTSKGAYTICTASGNL